MATARTVDVDEAPVTGVRKPSVEFEFGATGRGKRALRPKPQMAALPLEDFDATAGTATLQIGGERTDAIVDPCVSPRVLETAKLRGERVVAQREGGVWVVVGALRTSPTPGVDEGDEFVIKAQRVIVEAAHEFAVVTGAASFMLRAQGFVETVAQDITTRARSLHKIVGRMIRLN